MSIFDEIDWFQVDCEDIPCSKAGEGFDNENIWVHPCGEMRTYKNWWYLGDDGKPANAVDDGVLTELKGTAELAKRLDAQIAAVDSSQIKH